MEAITRQYSDLEKTLLVILSEMVAQNCTHREGVYETGWIGVHKEAMMTLAEHGIMVETQDGYGRGYWARFAPTYPWGQPQMWAVLTPTFDVKPVPVPELIEQSHGE